MAKSILEIEVASAEFTRYKELFDKYQEQLKAQPKLWAAIALQHQKLSQQQQFVAEAMDDEHKKLQDLGKVQDANRIHSEKSAESWVSLSKSSESFAKNLISTGSFLSKWGGLIFGGMIGGAFLGIDRATHDASSTRQQSLSLGASAGEIKAFKANYGRVVNDPDSLLQSVLGMETDPAKAKPWYFLQSYGLGKMTGNTVQDTASLLDAERRFAQRTPLSYIGSLANAVGLPSGVDQLRMFSGIQGKEWDQMRPGMVSDISRMNTPGAKSLQDLDTQFDRNTSAIWSSFQTQLARAAPALEKLSDAASRGAVSLINKGGDKLADIWKKVTSDPLRFAGDLLVDPAGTLLGSGPGSIDRWAVNQGTRLGSDPKSPITNAASILKPSILSAASTAKDWLIGAPAYGSFLTQTNAAAGLPDNLLPAIMKTESSGNLFPANSSKGAIGPFQFMPATAAGLGINPHDPWQSGVGAGQYMQTLLKEFGDLDKALGAWNWGPGNMEALMKEHPNDWQNFVPQETRGFINKTENNMRIPASITLNVKVSAPPGFSASVATSQSAF